MKTAIINGRIITPHRILDQASLVMEDGVIEGIVKGRKPEADCYIDAQGSYVSPGFIDIHTHGGGGHDFMDGTPEAIIKACMAHLAHGTTSICPTTLTCTDEELLTFLTATVKPGNRWKMARSFWESIWRGLISPWSKEEHRTRNI